nr:serine/threonine-protein kinase [Nannocystis pusilla]
MPPRDDRPVRWIGRIIDGRYRIVELLGEGGMGAVYVAEHLKLHKHVALKTIRAQFAANSQAEARFTREALATARLDHPHVVSAIDYGHLPEGGAYLVIQLVRGHSLTKRIEQGPLTWQQACKLGAQIADALAAAHGLGIIHRDLKPDNILLEPREGDEFHARVLDFGIARVSGGEGTGTIADISLPITRMGAVVGTPGYMAPEQAVGEKVDVRADLYALGVILWEACTGRYLWDAESLTDLFAAQLSKPAPHLHGATRLEVPPPLANLVAQLLARKPEERPATAVTVRDELRKLALSAEVSLILAAAGPATPAAISKLPPRAAARALLQRPQLPRPPLPLLLPPLLLPPLLLLPLLLLPLLLLPLTLLLPPLLLPPLLLPPLLLLPLLPSPPPLPLLSPRKPLPRLPRLPLLPSRAPPRVPAPPRVREPPRLLAPSRGPARLPKRPPPSPRSSLPSRSPGSPWSCPALRPHPPPDAPTHRLPLPRRAPLQARPLTRPFDLRPIRLPPRPRPRPRRSPPLPSPPPRAAPTRAPSRPAAPPRSRGSSGSAGSSASCWS